MRGCEIIDKLASYAALTNFQSGIKTTNYQLWENNSKCMRLLGIRLFFKHSIYDNEIIVVK